MRRILHITPNAYKDIESSGATRRIWLELSQDFEEYHVIGRSKDNKFHNYQEGKIYLHTLPGFGRRNASFGFTSILVGHYIKKYGIDGIICQCPILGGFWATHYAIRHSIPVLMEIHEIRYFDMLKYQNGIEAVYNKIIRYSLEHATIIRALNEPMKDMIIDAGIKNKNIEIVYNRVDVSLFNSPKSTFGMHNPIKLISVGNFIPSKDHQLAINTLKVLKDRGYTSDLTLIGGGPLYSKYEELASNLGVSVKLFDRIPQEQIVKIMSNCDIYIHSSLTEGMPRAVLEAMAMRMPVVTTAAGTTAGTIQNEKNGLLVPVGDLVRFSEALQKMIDDKSLREKLANQAYRDVLEKYEWNVCFNRYREVIQKLQRS